MAQWLADLTTLPILLLTASLSVVMILDGIPLVGLLIPADVAVMAAMATHGPVGGVPILLGVIGGYLVTASLNFLIGRHFGPQVRASRLGTIIGESRWAAGERILATRGYKMLCAAPFLPVINTIVPLVAGCLHMPYRRFVCSVAIGSTLWASLYISLGALAGMLSRSLPGGSLTTLSTFGLGFSLSYITMRKIRRAVAVVPEST